MLSASSAKKSTLPPESIIAAEPDGDVGPQNILYFSIQNRAEPPQPAPLLGLMFLPWLAAVVPWILMHCLA